VVSFLSVAREGKEERNEVGRLGRITKKKSGSDEQQVNGPNKRRRHHPSIHLTQECRTWAVWMRVHTCGKTSLTKRREPITTPQDFDGE
jgi:hypothetical protein